MAGEPLNLHLPIVSDNKGTWPLQWRVTNGQYVLGACRSVEMAEHMVAFLREEQLRRQGAAKEKDHEE